nr:hypothetical protein [Tanacetum cinerariifolium]
MMLIICHHPPRHINGTFVGVFGLQRGLDYLHKKIFCVFAKTLSIKLNDWVLRGEASSQQVPLSVARLMKNR